MFEALKRWLGFDKKPQCHTARMARMCEQAGDRYRSVSRQRRRFRGATLMDDGIDYAPPVFSSPLNVEKHLASSHTTPIPSSLLTRQNDAPVYAHGSVCEHHNHSSSDHSHADCDLDSSSANSYCD